VVREYVPVLGFTPLVRTNGPLDSVVSRGLADQLLAVLREALSNIARHAEAQAAMVEVDAADDRLVLRVVDNGKGLPADRHESGLRNVRRRATEHGGVVQMLPEEPSGTRLEWSVPLHS
jgi:signal transduction histidine kinase